MPAAERVRLWPVFGEVLAELRERRAYTWAGLARAVTARVREESTARWAHVVVDEAQDLGPAQLAFLRSLVRLGKNDLTLVADPGQQIFKSPFSWLSAGIEIGGRATRLRWSYRNSRAIAEFATAIRGRPETRGESRPIGARLRGLVVARACFDREEEIALVTTWLDRLRSRGIEAGDIAIFSRTKDYVRRVAAEAARRAGMAVHDLARSRGGYSGAAIALGTMHRAKGLERRAVAVVGCSEGFVPMTSVLGKLADPGEREIALEQERNLLYVAITRARELLLVTSVGAPSPFLRDALATLPAATT